jgi:branched-chain amino acid transport system substrate-binding protein
MVPTHYPRSVVRAARGPQRAPSRSSGRRVVRYGRKARLGLTVVGSLLLTACGSGPGAGNQESSSSPIKVAVQVSLTGTAAAPGADERAGLELAFEQAGLINGHKVDLSFSDDGGDPARATSAIPAILNSDVDFMVMPILANLQLAVRSAVAKSGVPAIVPVLSSAANIPGVADAPNIVGLGGVIGPADAALAKYVYEQGYRHVSTIGMDYAFGWSALAAFKRAFEAQGGTVDRMTWGPLNTPDWTPYISSLPTTSDAVVTLMAGANGPLFLKTYRGLGMKQPLFGDGVMTDFLGSLSEEQAGGVVTALHYADGIPTDVNKAFVQSYQQKTGRIPSYEGEAGYTAGNLIVQILKQTKGDVSDRKALVAALSTTPITAPRGRVVVDPNTLVAHQDEIIRRVEMVNGHLSNVPITTYQDVPAWLGYPSEAAWESLYPGSQNTRP